MKYNFDLKNDRSKTREIKQDISFLTNKYKVDPKKTIHSMWIADLDFHMPNKITDAIVQRANVGSWSYTLPSFEMNRSIVNWYKDYYNINDIDPNLIGFTLGVVTAIQEAIRTFTSTGDAIIIHTPNYHPFETSITSQQRKPIYSKLLIKNNNFEIDFEDFEKKIAKNKVKLFLFCNPQNPGGKVWSASDVVQLLTICKKYDVIVFSDEIHGELNYANNHNSSLRYSNIYNQVIVASSPNKLFNLGGLKGCYFLTRDQNMFDKMLEQIEFDDLIKIGAFFEPALLASYNNPDIKDWINQLKQYLISNFQIIKKELENINNVHVLECESSFLAWIKIDFKSTWENCKKALINEGLIFNTSEDMAQAEEGWVRLNFGITKSDLFAALQALKKALKKALKNC